MALLRRHVALSSVLAALCAMLAVYAATAAAPHTIVVLGDSVSAGYGLPAGSGWVSLLGKRLASDAAGWRVVNASISGDTTAGGRARLPALLAQHRPAVLVVELGGNDALRGGDLKATAANLDAIVATAQKAGARVLIVGMQVPPNYGAAYARQFEQLYTTVASKRHAALVPFLFAGFAEDERMFQQDRIHPTVSAQQAMLDNVWPQLRPLLK